MSFNTSNKSELENSISQHIAVLKKDSNFGIAKQVIDSWIKLRIKNLTKTYITLSLDDIAASVGLENTSIAEEWLLKMVSAGEISCKIDAESMMVRFDDFSGDQLGSEYATNNAIINTLENKLKETIELSKKVQDLQKDILTSKKYVMKVFSTTGKGSVMGGLGGSITATADWVASASRDASLEMEGDGN
jgi:COP9 signalosome complex subunit 3